MNEMIITSELLDEFRNHLYYEERSANTIEKYRRDISRFAANVFGKTLSKSTVIEYKNSLCESYLPATVNSVLSSLNAFFSFMNWHELKVKTLKIQRKIFSDKSLELTKAEYENLLNAAYLQKDKRLYYLVQTIAGTGIRVSELRFVTCEAVSDGKAVIRCKGKTRVVFLPKKLCKMLGGYIKSRGIKSGSVFVTRSGDPLDRSNIWKMLKKLCDVAGVPREKVFPHNLRHLFARTFYSLQKDIVRLADILGHSSIETTRIYTKESGEEHMKQLQKLGLLRC